MPTLLHVRRHVLLVTVLLGASATTFAQEGDVVLMHDHWAPVWETALPVVIEELRARGIGFSTICGPPVIADEPGS